ncbi:MAG TPA: metal-dependent transcriptional regulator [Chitinophagales bacterium]|nr:metal-dependent transcriptional regulator [Chitinophagales bacterium]HMW12733.1 metal-dependent transcriptional regulator [Chitinophagales bacterium]HMX60310.1 metal-dependent transcriptional regulator [Chitinophagales bacterium]HMY22928.1 metal-dependent transcriptional regulator [Chitinophagales bacterium]HMZ33998.1 metal-dependent transcriptional regulator [Chitinophagales bacterium]
MNNLSAVEENYLKYIYQLGETQNGIVKTNDLAYKLEHSAASVTDMLKRLSDKKLVSYKKYYGVSLTKIGQQIAIQVMRKHRLWETFLAKNLKFTWDKIHDIAEQLEHIQSDELVDKMDEYLGYPKFDPHGDPIPDKQGNILVPNVICLTDAKLKKLYILQNVNDDSASFLKYLNKIQLQLNDKIKIIEKEEFDETMQIIVNDKRQITISNDAAQNMFVKSV